MAHDIFQNRVATYRTLGWHELGTVLEFPTDAVSAAQLVGIDRVRFGKRDLYAILDEGSRQVLTMPGHKALVKEADGADPVSFVTVVPEDYAVMNYAEVCALARPLSELWPVETIGLLGEKGDTMFLTLDAGDWEVAGDEHRGFWCIVDYKIPGKAMRIFYVETRIVCRNTLQMGLRAANLTVKIPHRGASFHADAKFYVDITAQMRLAQGRTRKAIQKLAETPMTQAQMQAAIETAYPLPPRPQRLRVADLVPQAAFDADGALSLPVQKSRMRYEAQIERVKSYRSDVWLLTQRVQDEFPRLAGMALAVLNAGVEYADHRVGYRESESAVYRAESALFGKRSLEKERLYAALVDADLSALTADDLVTA